MIGIIYENVISGRDLATKELFLKSNLQLYLQTDVITNKYLWYVVKERLLFLTVTCFLSCMKWKKLFVLLFLLYIGFVMGIVTVAAVLQLGVLGVVLCIAGIMPQGVFYGIGYSVLLIYWFQFPIGRWNKTKLLFVVAMFLLGMIVEVYVNPILVKWVIGLL